MRKHACVHSDHKLLYGVCGKKMSSRDAMREHLQRHEDDKIYPCGDCEKQFSSLLACKIHYRGKHGEGYLCNKCQMRFDTPIQWCHHAKKCSSGGNADEYPPRMQE